MLDSKRKMVDQSHILKTIHPVLRPTIEYLYLNPLGVCSKFIPITIDHKHNVVDEEGYRYYFMLSIPYAGQTLYWDVYFADCFTRPDFDFGEKFLYHPNVSIIDKVPSLGKWDCSKPSTFHDVLKEYLNLFEEEQVIKLNETQYLNCNTEYKSLLENDINDKKLEIMVVDTTVHFLIQLDVDTSEVPFMIMKETINPGEPTAALRVIFSRNNTKTPKVDLHLSAQLDHVFGGSKNLNIPPFTTIGNLWEYVQAIIKLIDDKLALLVKYFNLKMEYISYLQNLFAANIIEYDSLNFSRCVLHFENGDKSYYISYFLNNKFPEEAPKISLKSVYDDGPQINKSFIYPIESYPYSPRWEAKEMIDRAMKTVEEEVPRFLNRNSRIEI